MRAHSAGIGGPEPAAARAMPTFMPESLFAMQKGA
jgi:hypothetical protein